ncbi:S-layer homology domain-containing protein [Bacillus dakarensis]|uniref:S-layer homology domain-containing protein n=1 Tax=Robertmurraya dakarensis TaxID=1926278 RepID=UPI000980DFDC|nr:S-layer homology domain-containing protein [Bacillus dakarensis]
MKALRITLSLVCLFALLPFTASAEEKATIFYFPSDVPDDHWALEEIDDFLAAEIITGSVSEGEGVIPNVRVQPEGFITRAQFTKMIVNALNLEAAGSAKSFPDVNSSAWYYPYVQIATSHGIINGKEDGKFYPNDKINRGQMAAMIYRAFKDSITFNSTGKTFTDVPPNHWAAKEVNTIAANEIIKGNGQLFQPLNFATRAHGIVMIHRALRQEDTNLPSDSELKSTLTNHINEERNLLNTSNFNELKSLYTRDGFGYYRSQGVEITELYQSALDEGDTLRFEPIGDFSVTVEMKSNRYAKLYVDNLIYKEIYHSSKYGNLEEPADYSNDYYLQKDNNGNWKIYNIGF